MGSTFRHWPLSTLVPCTSRPSVRSASGATAGERGIVRFDEEMLLLSPPMGDRITIGFAIADDQQPLQWNDPVGGEIPVSPVTALHGANRGRESHTFLLEGTGGDTHGVLMLPAWRQGDLVLLDLPAGTYRLHDPAVPGSELTLRVMGDG